MHMTMVALSLMLVGQPPISQSSTSKQLEEPAQAFLIDPRTVPAKEAGVLAELLVTEGDLVEENQSLGVQEADLAEIDRRLAFLELDIARLQSENDVDQRFAEVAWDVAKADMRRYQDATDRYPKAVTAAEMDRQRLVVKRSELSIEQAQRDLRIAELTKQVREQALRGADKHLTNRKIEAPVGGEVVEVFVHPGEWLNVGDPVVRIVEVERLHVECLVNGDQYAKEELIGRPVIFTVTLPPHGESVQYEGKVIFVNPELNPVSKRGTVRAEVANPDLRLRAGMSGTLTILLGEPASTVP